jgi:hypothetical protein
MTTHPSQNNQATSLTARPGRGVHAWARRAVASRGKPQAGRNGPLRRWALLPVLLVALAGILSLAGAGAAAAAAQSPGHEALGQAGAPTTVLALTGDNQTTTTRSPFAIPMQVLVLDDNGHVAAGATVTFHIYTGYSGLTGTAHFADGAQSADVMTGTDGRASAPALTAGPDVGPLRVQASVPEGTQTASFFLRVGYSPAAHVSIVSGDGQSALVATRFDHPVVVQVLDAHGYPVADGSKVEFRIEQAGPNPGLAEFTDGTTTATVGINSSNGYATSPAMVAGSRAGDIKVVALVPQAPAVPDTVFTGTVLPQAPTTLEVAGGNYQFGSSNSAFPAHLQVRVLDQAGNPIAWPTAHVIVTGPATIYGRTSLDVAGDQNGVISMTLAAGDGTGPVTVTVTDGTATATFHEFIAAPGAIRLIPMGGDNQETQPSQPFYQLLRASVEDSAQRTIPGFPVTFAVDGPAVFADGAKSDTITSSDQGDATAPRLYATDASGPVTVTVTIAGSDVFATFHLTVGKVDRLIILGGDKQTAPAQSRPVWEHSFPAPLTVEAIAATDHPEGGVPVTYTVHGPAQFVVDGVLGVDTIQVFTGSQGQASATLFPKYNETGPVTVTASAPDFGSVTFTATVVPAK